MKYVGRECIVCLVPLDPIEPGAMFNTVVRRIEDPCSWALDLDLHDEFPTVWGKPERVRPSVGCKCRECFKRLMASAL